MDGGGQPQQQMVCAKEALELLNCVTDPSFDREKCISFLNALRTCVLEKKVKKFSLAQTNHPEPDTKLKEKQ